HVFFLVPTGRGQSLEPATIREYRDMLDAFYRVHKAARIECKATCAPQFYRLLAEKNEPVHTKGCLAGTHFGFVSSTGTIQPCGFLQIPCGNIREGGFHKAWESSQTLAALRDENALKGKCGRCGFKDVCGGCRARAFEVRGDLVEADPVCWYRTSKE
ncbi:MAG TPA: SPASM domain-containing protein, partial [Deltaproteobacteria bacterium]|nr:SPASM domain-containing protein [Deltaproteobacteria bacterium]